MLRTGVSLEVIDNTKVFSRLNINYVKCNMDRGHRRVLTKFRSCNLPLAIVTGRYDPKTPISERICK